MLAPFINDIRNWFYEKKISFFSIFSSFLDTLKRQKDFFCTFGPKITCFYILGWQHVHLTPILTSWSPYKVGLTVKSLKILSKYPPLSSYLNINVHWKLNLLLQTCWIIFQIHVQYIDRLNNDITLSYRVLQQYPVVLQIENS